MHTTFVVIVCVCLCVCLFVPLYMRRLRTWFSLELQSAEVKGYVTKAHVPRSESAYTLYIRVRTRTLHAVNLAMHSSCSQVLVLYTRVYTMCYVHGWNGASFSKMWLCECRLCLVGETRSGWKGGQHGIAPKCVRGVCSELDFTRALHILYIYTWAYLEDGVYMGP